eukprot:146296-Prorocentrum_minimum.AAC.1
MPFDPPESLILPPTARGRCCVCVSSRSLGAAGDRRSLWRCTVLYCNVSPPRVGGLWRMKYRFKYCTGMGLDARCPTTVAVTVTVTVLHCADGGAGHSVPDDARGGAAACYCDRD